jgi:hypothetical protein
LNSISSRISFLMGHFEIAYFLHPPKDAVAAEDFSPPSSSKAQEPGENPQAGEILFAASGGGGRNLRKTQIK